MGEKPREPKDSCGREPLISNDVFHICDTRQTVALDIVRRPKATPLHELKRYLRCNCSQVRGYPYKRSHLVALRATKITASDPPSHWWPGERD
jgi:hypothetical protein